MYHDCIYKWCHNWYWYITVPSSLSHVTWYISSATDGKKTNYFTIHIVWWQEMFFKWRLVYLHSPSKCVWNGSSLFNNKIYMHFSLMTIINNNCLLNNSPKSRSVFKCNWTYQWTKSWVFRKVKVYYNFYTTYKLHYICKVLLVTTSHIRMITNTKYQDTCE
jgi:hypothetical protein